MCGRHSDFLYHTAFQKNQGEALQNTYYLLPITYYFPKIPCEFYFEVRVKR